MGGLKGGADPEMLGRGNQWDSVEMWREGFPGSEQTQEGPLLWDTPCPAPSLAIGFRWAMGTSIPHQQAGGADNSLSSSLAVAQLSLFPLP